MSLSDAMIFEKLHAQSGKAIQYGTLGLDQDASVGPKCTVNLDGNSAGSMTYFCRWHEVAHFVEAMLGENYVGIDSEGNERLMRTPPEHIRFPYMFSCFATNAEIVKGIPGKLFNYDTQVYDESPVHNNKTYLLTDTGGTSSYVNSGTFVLYEYAVVRIDFSPLPYEVWPDSAIDTDKEWQRYTTVERTPRVDLLHVSSGLLKWVETDLKKKPESVPTDMPLRVQAVDYVVTWHRVPFVFPESASYVGYVNNSGGFLDGQFQVPVGGFDEGTMLLLGVREQIHPQPFDFTLEYKGKFLYTYSFYFQHRENTHNNSLRRREATKGDPATATYEFHDFSLTGRPATLNKHRAIKYANMDQLFQARS